MATNKFLHAVDSFLMNNKISSCVEYFMENNLLGLKANNFIKLRGGNFNFFELAEN